MGPMPRVVLGWWGILLAAPGLLNGGPSSAETRFSDAVVVTQALDDDLYAAGGEVRIEGAIAGAAVLAAGSAEISGDVAGDLILAGGQINLAGGVGDDLRVAGGSVQITGFVTDNATISGGTVTIGPGSAIGGRTWIAGGDVDMAGQIGGDLRVVAGTAVISGRVAGNLDIAAREIRVEPGTIIGGNLVWRSNQPPVIAEDVQILGEVREAGGDESQSLVDEPSDRFDGGWALGVGVAAAALILLWFAPQLVARSAAIFQAAPGRTLVLGAASLVLTPIMAFLLIVTVLGWLLGLVVLAGYVFGLMLSGLLGLLIIVQSLRGRFGAAVAPVSGAAGSGGWRHLVLLLLVLAALVLAQQVPVLGGLLSLLLVLAGFGALTTLVTGRATGVAGSPAG